jgi:hypothetical protein
VSEYSYGEGDAIEFAKAWCAANKYEYRGATYTDVTPDGVTVTVGFAAPGRKVAKHQRYSFQFKEGVDDHTEYIATEI